MGQSRDKGQARDRMRDNRESKAPNRNLFLFFCASD